MRKQRIFSFNVITGITKILDRYGIITSLNFPIMFKYNIHTDFYKQCASFNVGSFERYIKFSDAIGISGEAVVTSFLTENSYFTPRILFTQKRGELYGASFFLKKNIDELIEIFYIMCDVFELESKVKIEKKAYNFITFGKYIDDNDLKDLDVIRKLKWQDVDEYYKTELKVIGNNFIGGR